MDCRYLEVDINNARYQDSATAIGFSAAPPAVWRPRLDVLLDDRAVRDCDTTRRADKREDNDLSYSPKGTSRHAASAIHQRFRGTDIIKTTTAARAVTAVLFGRTIVGAPKLALADIKNYELQLVEPPV